MLTYQVGEEGHGVSKIALFLFLLFLLRRPSSSSSSSPPPPPPPPPLSSPPPPTPFPSETYGMFLFIHKIVPQPEGRILILSNCIFWFTGCG